MKHLTILTILISTLLPATHAIAELPSSRPITLHLDNTPLPEALKAIQNVSGLNIAFAHELVDGAAPVTLDIKDQPAGEVLYRLLRERGLVPIQTAETMAAVVDDASEIGVVKIAGRAMRTFVRLAHKFDKAEQHGDEVRVPGWTAEDDDVLIDAAIDFAAAVYYRESDGRRSTEQLLAEFERLLNLPDPDLHIGFLIAFSNWGGPSDDEVERSKIIDLLRAKFDDTDACVRASALMGAGIFSERMQTPLSDILELSANGSAPEVRFVSAVMLSAGMLPNQPQQAATRQKLLNDPHAGVRTAARFAVWERDWRNIAEDKADLFCANAVDDLAAEPNPIAKAIMTLTAMAYARDHLPVLLAHLDKIEPEADPWLKMIVDISRPLFLEMYSQRRAHVEMEAGAAPVAERAPAPGPKETFGRFMQLALSGKRSHQVIALGMTRLTVASVMMGANEAAPDLTPLAALADSQELPARLLGTLGVVLSRRATFEFYLKLINSDRRIDRLLGVIAPSFPGGPPPSEEVKNALKKSALSGDFAESALAISMLRNNTDAEELLAMFDEQAKRAPKSIHSSCSLRACLAPADSICRKHFSRSSTGGSTRKTSRCCLPSSTTAMKICFSKSSRATMTTGLTNSRMFCARRTTPSKQSANGCAKRCRQDRKQSENPSQP